jgi:hypothetical protein
MTKSKSVKKKVWRALDFQEGFGNQKNGKLRNW